MERIFFISDPHFFHRRILKYTGRPFLSPKALEVRSRLMDDRGTMDDLDWWNNYKVTDEEIQAQDETLINNWNDQVRSGDRVYCLGDFAFESYSKARDVFNRLNGQKYLIRGNHDREKKIRDLFIWCKDYHKLSVDDPDASRGRQKIILCHYPFRTWDQMHHGSWHLYGHEHCNISDEPDKLALEISVEAIASRLLNQCSISESRWEDYRPVSYEEIKSLMQEKASAVHTR